MSAVKASPFDPAALIRQFEEAAARQRFRVDRFGEVGGCPLIGLTRRTPGPRPRIYLSTGVHGDEPAPPLALLQLLETGGFDAAANWFLMPMLNPTGFGRATRENADGIDLNRDYRAPSTPEVRGHIAWLQRQPRFDLALCLHEDWEATGFYLYELNAENRPSLAHAVLKAAAAHVPIDPATVIDGREIAEPGIIRPVNDPLLRDQWPEAIYLRAHHSVLGYTFETPSSHPLETRVNAIVTAVRTALAGLRA